MPALNVEYTEDELTELRAAANAAGKSLKSYVHDVSVREQQRRAFVTGAVRFFDENVEEFDRALPEDAPDRATRAA